MGAVKVSLFLSTSIDGEVAMNTVSQLHGKRPKPGSMVRTKVGKGLFANV